MLVSPQTYGGLRLWGLRPQISTDGGCVGCHSLMAQPKECPPTPTPAPPHNETATGTSLGSKCGAGRQGPAAPQLPRGGQKRARGRGCPGADSPEICSLHAGAVLGVSGHHGQRFRLPRNSRGLFEMRKGDPGIPSTFPPPARPAPRR